MKIQLVGLDLNDMLNLGWRLANMDAMTAGVILMFSGVVFLLLNGGSNERKRRRLTGVILPPAQTLDAYLKELDRMHNR